MGNPELIYDVGMHNGDDTAFYLARGFNVVAIEADPTLVAAANARFEREIAERRLTIVNVGIADRDGEADFWICEAKTEWNSFDQTLASRDNAPHHRVTVPTREFAGLLREYGVPHYLKVDIEGYDRKCLEDLATIPSASRPQFISWENEVDSPSRIATSSLRLVHELGYRRFKLIDQSTFGPVTAGVSLGDVVDSVGWRVTRVFALSGAIRRTAWSYLTYRGAFERRFSWRFQMGCSGPWGNSAAGRWLTYEEASSLLKATTVQLHTRQHGALSFWCDWHASF
jgi:FkbM family methyltransferase